MAALDSDQLFLGADLDPLSRQRTERLTGFDPDDLVTHGVIVGMTGSGKTGLGVVLLEETLLAGIPCLIIDPKGDLANLALTFPELSAEQFLPWVDSQQAGRDGMCPEQAATQAAQEWKEGLAQWGIDGSRIQALREAATVTVYTPGSRSGVGLNLIGSFGWPGPDIDEESRNDEIEGLVAGLLALADVEADPLTSPEHILLSNLIAHAWSAGRDLDLASLLALVQDPPLRKLGVLDLDTFFPPKARMALVLRLNGLLASPSFQAWSEGQPIDIEGLWRDPEGRPRAAVISLAHLSDAERQFVVTLLLSKLVTWMRRQSGTTSLRGLIYMDEVFGYVPPTAMPASKKPILTILKQARAYGVGMVLATQNPIDLDYRALSNAGTWMIGRLQTERDKARLLEGLTAASGSIDVAQIDATISALAKRQFVLQRAGASGLRLFTTRWAMSYLRGPLDRGQLQRLRGATPPGPGAHTGGPNPPAAPARPALAADETSVAPSPPDTVTVAYLDPAAPWAAQVGAVPGGLRYEAALVAKVRLRFDDARAQLNHTEEWEALLPVLGPELSWAEAMVVDHDPRDLRVEPPPGVRYVLSGAALDRATFFRTAHKRLVDHLRLTEDLTLLRNRRLGLLQRPSEPEADFRQRLERGAEERSDAEARLIRDKLAERTEDLRQAIADAQERVEELDADQRRRRAGGLLQAAGGLLGAFLGGKRSSRTLARSIGRAAGEAVGGSASPASLGQAEQRARKGQRDLAGVEAGLAKQLVALDQKWTAAVAETDTLHVSLSAADITVEQLSLCWIPKGP